MKANVNKYNETEQNQNINVILWNFVIYSEILLYSVKLCYSQWNYVIFSEIFYIQWILLYSVKFFYIHWNYVIFSEITLDFIKLCKIV